MFSSYVCCAPLIVLSLWLLLSEAKILSQSDHLKLIRQSLPLLENKTLTACVIVREPFVIFNEPEVDGKSPEALADLGNYGGVAIEVIKRLTVIFKFKLKIVRPPDGQFGVLVPGKGWSGLMGSLVRKESDIGVTALSITVTRAQVIDFTRAYYVETVAILLRTPEEVQNYLAIFEPFSLTVWLVLLATVMVLIFLITLMTKLEDEQREQHRVQKLSKFLTDGRRSETSLRKSLLSMEANEDDEDQEYARKLRHKIEAIEEAREHHEFGDSWLERFYYATSCVLNILLIRDIQHPPSQTPIRILVCVWWLSTIVIVNIYLGILFGQLVVPRRLRTIETLQELVNQNLVDWCVTGGSAIYELFRQSNASTVYGKVGAGMKFVSSADEGVKSVLQLGRAFIRERSILTFKVAKEHNRLRACRMQFAKEEFFSVGFGLGLQKNSPYAQAFDSALTLMIENGFVAHWQSMYWPTKNQYTECGLQPLQEGEPLSIKHFISIYVVCAGITSVSLIILIYQNFHEHLISSQLKPMYRRWKRKLLDEN